MSVGIPAQCSDCGKQYNLKDELAGKKVRCPKCKGVVRVPAVRPKAGHGRPAPKSRPPALVADAASTSYTAPPQRRKPAGKQKLVTATTCPSCGKALPNKAPSCAACGYNVKLGRRMSITQAIKAADRTPGVRADGSTYKTREEKGEERVQAGRKVYFGTILGTLVFISLLALGVFWAARKAWWGPDLEDRAITANLPRKVIEDKVIPSPGPHFHPYCIGYRVETTIDKRQIRLQKVDPVSGGTGTTAWTAFAQKALLPLYVKKAFPESMVRRVLLEKLPEIDGTFSPSALEAGVTIPDEGLFFVREAATPAENGFLNGFLLDTGSESQAFLTELKKAGRYLSVTGTLYFVASRDRDLSDGPYAAALRKQLERVPEPGVVGKVPPLAEQGEETEEMSYYYFHPVVKVSLYSTTR